MDCPGCGREVVEESRFCSWCGRDLAAVEAPAEAVPPPAQPAIRRERPIPHPWLRYFARSLDIAVMLFLVVAGLAALGIPLEGWLEVALGSVVYGALFALESVSLSRAGTTLGKWLFRIRVVRKDGGRPTLPQSARRSFAVFVRGLAMGLPVISLFAQALGYVQLMREGEASWDRDSGTMVKHGSISPARAALIVVVFFAVVSAVVLALRAAGFPVPGDDPRV